MNDSIPDTSSNFNIDYQAIDEEQLISSISVNAIDENRAEIDVLEQYDLFSFFSLMRYLESSKFLQKKSFGLAQSPDEDVVRIRQEPNLSFPSQEISNVKFKHQKLYIELASFGLMGINSPLPAFLLEYIFQRKHHHGDGAWSDFLNMLQHRLITLFYRSWSSAQSILFLENNEYDKFNTYVKSLIGLNYAQMSNGIISEYSKLYFSGFLLKPKSSANLTKLLNQYFEVPFRIEENIGEWYEVPEDEQTCLSTKSVYSLGDGLLVGSRIHDMSSKIRIVIGPLDLESYTSFFKGSVNFNRLREWLTIYLNQEYRWEVQPVLMQEEIPKLEFGITRVGLNGWLGSPNRDGNDLIIQGF